MIIACDVALLQLTGSPDVHHASCFRLAQRPCLLAASSLAAVCHLCGSAGPLLYYFVMHRNAHRAHLAAQAMGLTLSRNLWASANPAYVFRDPMYTVSAYKQDFLWDEDEVRQSTGCDQGSPRALQAQHFSKSIKPSIPQVYTSSLSC